MSEQNVPFLNQWQSIETAPKQRKIIVHYLNPLGKHRVVMACYYAANSLEMHDDYEAVGTYDDATGITWADEGWYEEHDSDNPVLPLGGTPTHWMPLPAPPRPVAPASASPDDLWREAVAWVREQYPEDVFPPDGTSVDSGSARMARLTCDNILRRHAQLAEDARDAVQPPAPRETWPLDRDECARLGASHTDTTRAHQYMESGTGACSVCGRSYEATDLHHPDART